MEGISMPMHPKVVTFEQWKGINTTNSPQTTPQGYLKSAINMDLDKTGNLQKRKGYTLLTSGNISGLWASTSGLGCYGVVDGELVQIYSDYSFSSPLLTLPSGSSLSFEEVDDKIYFCNKDYNGIISNGLLKSWGITKTQGTLALSPTTGNLDAGTYQINHTFVNIDGIESGCSEAQVITLPASSSGITITLSNVIDPSIAYARIYCSTQDGRVLYYSGICLPNSSFTVSSASNLSNPLRTFNLDKAPQGQIVRYHNGRLYIASENILWYSEKYQYQHFNLAENYIEFPTRIRELMPLESGIWIGSDKLYFLSGTDPKQFTRITKDVAEVVEGTGTKVPGIYSIQPMMPSEYYWLVTTNLGIYALKEQGALVNQTLPNVELENSNSGNGLLLRTNGMNQYLSMLKPNSTPNNQVVGDLVETTIVRNGIIIT
jgi:hypothetical protein